MATYQYILDKSSKKYYCPDCGKRRFVKYVDIETSEYLPDNFGVCDRLINCGYNCNPYKDGYHKSQITINNYKWQPKPIRTDYKKIDIIQYPIPENVLLHTLKDYDKNNFIQYLLTKYNADVVTKQIENYFLGTVNNYTSFAYIDCGGTCRAIALIQYDNSCKRLKNDIQARNIHTYLQTEYKNSNQTPPNWLTNYVQNESKFTCLYGEHLINQTINQYKPIGLVEAPKTAFIASLVYPNYVWLAVGALSYLTADRVKAIQGREVYLFPDTSTESKAYNLWIKKAKQFGFTCIDLLEKLSTNDEKLKGYDLADYILENDFKNEINKVKIIEPETQTAFQPIIDLKENKTPEKTNLSKDNIHIAFIDGGGILYIPKPFNDKAFSRYLNGITAYNQRIEIPDTILIKPNDTKEVYININSLKIDIANNNKIQ